MIDAAASLFLLLQIFFVDLLLGADNAIVIALACGRLRPEDTRRAIVLGAGGAIVLRLVMILFANALLGVPLVKLAGAWMLIVIALNVRRGGGRRRRRRPRSRRRVRFRVGRRDHHARRRGDEPRQRGRARGDRRRQASGCWRSAS